MKHQLIISNISKGVAWFNQDGTAKVMAVYGLKKDLSRVGHYGFTEFELRLNGVLSPDEIHAKDLEAAEQALSLLGLSHLTIKEKILV